MIVWVSKYALTSGITKHEAKIKGCYAYPGAPFFSYASFRLGKEAHVTEEGAIRAAEAMRIKKIAALKRQIAKLESMRFGE